MCLFTFSLHLIFLCISLLWFLCLIFFCIYFIYILILFSCYLPFVFPPISFHKHIFSCINIQK